MRGHRASVDEANERPAVRRCYLISVASSKSTKAAHFDGAANTDFRRELVRVRRDLEQVLSRYGNNSEQKVQEDDLRSLDDSWHRARTTSGTRTLKIETPPSRRRGPWRSWDAHAHLKIIGGAAGFEAATLRPLSVKTGDAPPVRARCRG